MQQVSPINCLLFCVANSQRSFEHIWPGIVQGMKKVNTHITYLKSTKYSVSVLHLLPIIIKPDMNSRGFKLFNILN
jgi:hypothetical protein